MKKKTPGSASRRLWSEPHALARVTAANADGSAIGAPTRGSSERTVVVELDGVHPAADTARCGHVVSAIPQVCQHIGGHAILNLHLETLGPKTRCLHCLL